MKKKYFGTPAWEWLIILGVFGGVAVWWRKTHLESARLEREIEDARFLTLLTAPDPEPLYQGR